MVTLKQKNWTYFLMGGLLALVIIIGIGRALAQTGDEDPAPTPEAEQTTPDTDKMVPGFGFGRRGFGRFGGGDSEAHGEALAEALGITVDELDAAKQDARAAAIAQAVADGELTQEQADELLANGFGGRGWHWRFSGEMDTYLAEALGISVEALEEAHNEVFAAQLAAMVEAGMITQEQADFALAQRAVQEYVDNDALEATVRSAYEEAVAQALADGVITQEQADQLLAQLSERSFNFRGFGFGRHRHGGPGGGRGFGGPRGFFGNSMAPNTEMTPSVTDTGSGL